MTTLAANVTAAEPVRALPSGRSVVIRQAGGHDEIEVRSPEGAVEVRITLTDAGPVVTLRGARLELESPGEVTVNCRRFALRATEDAELHSQGELRVRSDEEMHLNGKMINLNC